MKEEEFTQSSQRAQRKIQSGAGEYWGTKDAKNGINRLVL